jgi:hypothetical protein
MIIATPFTGEGSEFCLRRASCELAVDRSVRFELVTEEAVRGILDRVFAFGLDAS